MRLIDADALLQEFETENVAHNSDLWHITGIKAFIENQPAVYDPEKVVSELEKYKYSHLVEHDSERYEHCKGEEINCDGRDCFLCVWDKAISIVRKGGAT